MSQDSRQWLLWVEQMQSIAQNGLTFSKDKFDRERYQLLLNLAMEIASQYSSHDFEQIQDIFSEEKYYLTPKVDVRGAVFKDDKVLLVQESLDNTWSLPGGYADVGESPSEAIEREILEESGITATTSKLAALLDKRKQKHPASLPHIYKVFFICDYVSGEPRPSIETLDAKWFALDQLPADLSLHRVLPEHIERLYQHYLHPELATDYD